jgi:hypothetical protein
MEQSPFWDSNSHSASQESSLLLLNTKVHFLVHERLALVPILSQLNPIRTFPSCFSKIHLFNRYFDMCGYIFFSFVNIQKTNSTEQSLSWETTGRSADQDIPRHLWGPKVQYCVYKSHPLDPILRQMHPVHALTAYFFLILSSHLHRGLPSGLFSSAFYVFILFPLRVTCPPISSSVITLHWKWKLQHRNDTRTFPVLFARCRGGMASPIVSVYHHREKSVWV